MDEEETVVFVADVVKAEEKADEIQKTVMKEILVPGVTIISPAQEESEESEDSEEDGESSQSKSASAFTGVQVDADSTNEDSTKTGGSTDKKEKKKPKKISKKKIQ